MKELALFRSAKLDDVNALIKFSKQAGVGITSLPRNAKILEERVRESQRSFNQWIRAPKHEVYLFCLEWKGKVIGASGLMSRIGMNDSFFAYHLLNEQQRSEHLKIDRALSVLHLIQARKKPTEVGTLFLEKPFRQKGLGKLLSYARFLFIALFRYRFAPTIIGEIRGLNIDGQSPFWDAIGRRFFAMDFSEADQLRTDHPECIEEIFPKHPIYTSLLSEEAQRAMSRGFFLKNKFKRIFIGHGA